jgi:hypothetical protein
MLIEFVTRDEQESQEPQVETPREDPAERMKKALDKAKGVTT